MALDEQRLDSFFLGTGSLHSWHKKGNELNGTKHRCDMKGNAVFRIIKYFTAIIIDCRLAELWKINHMYTCHCDFFIAFLGSRNFFPNPGTFPLFLFGVFSHKTTVNTTATAIKLDIGQVLDNADYSLA